MRHNHEQHMGCTATARPRLKCCMKKKWYKKDENRDKKGDEDDQTDPLQPGIPLT